MHCPKCKIELEEDVKTCPGCGTSYGTSHNFFENVARVEQILLSAILGTMILVVLIQILLRNFFYSGIPGGDSLVRHLLLWVGFVGAGLATRHGAHIKIDAAYRILPKKVKLPAGIIADIFSIAVCGVLFFASYQFLCVEYEGHGALPFFQLPVWVAQIIIPLGYLIIGLRIASGVIEKIIRMVKGE